MPRHFLKKHSVIQIQDSPHPTKLTGRTTSGHWAPRFPQSSPSDEEPSDCSSTGSGRNSTQNDLILSLTNNRPTVLQLLQLGGVSSSSSSDSLSSSTNSPGSSYPLGHISLLPRILENLIVSPNAKAADYTTLKSPYISSSEQLSSQIAPDDQVTTARPLLTSDQLPLISPLSPVSPSFSKGVSPQSPNDLSPTTRKRTHSFADNNGGSPSKDKEKGKARRNQTASKKGKSKVVDELTTSPVSGTIIRLDEAPQKVDKDVIIIRRGDVDKSLNIVEVSDQAKAELAKIENKIGAFDCRLCKLHFEDAFGLASHNCSRIVNIEYMCPECGKTFHCPANLASHRRWHKPRPSSASNKSDAKICDRSSSSPKTAKSEPSQSPDAPLSPLIRKPSSDNIPFKKRFLFDGVHGAVSNEQNLTSENSRQRVEATSSVKDNLKSTGNVATDAPHFYCHICHSLVEGAQAFAIHFQKCLEEPVPEVRLPPLLSFRK